MVDKKILLGILKGERAEVLAKCSCSISRLYDKLPEGSGGFPKGALSQVILPVNAYRSQGAAGKQYFAFDVVMQGFYCFIAIPRLPFSQRTKHGFLRPLKHRVRAAPLYFLDCKPLADSMVFGLRKHLERKSTI
ncbi:hypothetical protein EOW65_14590 [Sinirhodobacter ferrireducens]|uniref:Uncharacterized protein n=1 Tax=Paenirhodobacter ferrireducens TaxID=1215032 RepID=A0A443LB09_9RHOB|nr:hypothetical protein [Sinirhodobacter ferrireducens]RWR46336.1 hypothetical protein EOW65_14590 [Sinirhodobacter ferrireducens]